MTSRRLARVELLEMASQRAEDARGFAGLAPAYPSAAERAYAQRLASFSDQVAALVRALPAEPSEGDYRAFQTRVDSLSRKYEPAARAMANRVAAQSRAEAARLMGKPIRLGQLARAEELQFVDTYARYQVQLLQKIGRDQVSRIRKYRETDRDIEESIWLVKNRTKLLAERESQALSFDVLSYWCQREGSEEYVWITSRDERVRAGHRRLHGTRQRWDDPPETGRREGRNHPGHPAGCRCRALPLEAWLRARQSR